MTLYKIDLNIFQEIILERLGSVDIKKINLQFIKEN